MALADVSVIQLPMTQGSKMTQAEPFAVAPPTVRVASSRAALIAIAALLATVTNAVAFMLPPLLPVIQTGYADNSLAAATWVFTALVLGGGGGYVMIPRLTDVLSDRSISLLSGGILIAGALVAAVIDNYPALVVGAVLLGFGSAAQLVPLSFLRRHLDGNAVATAVTVLIMATGSGVVLGMLGGGLSMRYAIENDATPSISLFFYILAGLFALTTFGLLVVVPNDPPQSNDPIGVLNTVWLIGWVALILLGLSAPPGSAVDRQSVLILLVGVLAALAWAFVEQHAETPVFDMAILKKPFVATACLSAGLFGAVDAAFLVLVNYYAQSPKDLIGYGLSLDALETGLIMLPFAIAMFISGKAAENVVARGTPGLVLVVGAAICAGGLLFLALAHDQVWHYAVGSAVIGLGSRAGYSGAFTVPQFVVPEHRAGMAAGMPGTIMAIGFAVGSAMVVSIQLSSGTDYDGVWVPAAETYTSGYYYTLAFPVLIVVATLVSRFRNPNGFKMVVGAAY